MWSGVDLRGHAEVQAERLKNGIYVDDETWSQLSAIAERYQILVDR